LDEAIKATNQNRDHRRLADTDYDDDHGPIGFLYNDGGEIYSDNNFKNNNDLWKNSDMEADYFDGNVAKAQMKALARVADWNYPKNAGEPLLLELAA
jgi:hypothetical protein